MQEVNSVIHSFPTDSSNDSASCSCINLLGVSKKRKQEIIKEIYEQFVRYGREATVLVSMSTSCKLFEFVLNHTPQITFLNSRIKNQNKRYDAILLKFLTPKPQ